MLLLSRVTHMLLLCLSAGTAVLAELRRHDCCGSATADGVSAQTLTAQRRIMAAWIRSALAAAWIIELVLDVYAYGVNRSVNRNANDRK
ncbi:hypothetical protein P5V15_015630 [Pogonomyrmex californicus]